MVREARAEVSSEPGMFSLPGHMLNKISSKSLVGYIVRLGNHHPLKKKINQKTNLKIRLHKHLSD